MKELLAIIVVLLFYIALQLTLTERNLAVAVQNEANIKTEQLESESPLQSQHINHVIPTVNHAIPTVNHTIPSIVQVSNNSHSNHSHSHSNCALPINIPTRGECENYRQLGVLTNSDNSRILPLFGKKLWNGSSKALYYTQTDRFLTLHLPVFKNGRDCSAEYGCDELFDKDEVSVPQLDESFVVTLYHLDSPRYIPYIC
jgi:hypothetical protein|tara:strand:+ start:7900 stop:8499 length:600 start_codon:yes stop_codon:yes gene_type:complete